MGFRNGGPFGTLGIAAAPDGVRNDAIRGKNAAHFTSSYNATFTRGPSALPGNLPASSSTGSLRMAGVSTLTPVSPSRRTMNSKQPISASFRPPPPMQSMQSNMSASRSEASLSMRSTNRQLQFNPEVDVLRSQEAAEARRRTLEMLSDPHLQQISEEIFKAHDAEKNGRLEFDDLCSVLRTLHAELDLPAPDVQMAESLFKKYDVNNDKSLTHEEFFDLLKALLRRSAFDRSTVVNREFFITKNTAKVWSVFDKVKELGAGTFGKAYLAKNKGSGEERVVKAVQKSRTNMPLDDIEAEILIMRQVDHPHIVRLFEWYEDKTKFYLVLEALKGGTLKEVMLMLQKQQKGLKEAWIRSVTCQSVEAMAFVHGLRLIHKDLKDENIMLLKKDPNFDEPFAVIIDLGIAEMFSLADPNGREMGGTPTTMAPEVWLGTFGPKCDVFSMGCILFEMLSGQYPFMAPSLSPKAWTKLHKKGPDWSLVKTSMESKDLCKQMLKYSEHDRPSMRDCREHQYFTMDRRQLTTVPAKNFQHLVAYCQQQQVKQHLLLEIAARLPMDRANKVVELFQHIDNDHSGHVSAKELKAYFKEMGITDDHVVQATFNALDVDQDGQLSFSEFAAGALLLFKDMLEERLQDIFNRHDASHNGELDEAEAQDFLEDVFAAMDKDKSVGSMRGKQHSALDELMKNCPKTGRGVTYKQLRDYVLGPENSPRPPSA